MRWVEEGTLVGHSRASVRLDQKPTDSPGQGPEVVFPRLSHTMSPRFGLCWPVHLLGRHPAPIHSGLHALV